MLSVISLLLGGVSSLISGFFSEKTQSIKSSAEVTIAETTASQIISTDNKDDIWLRFLRDIACVPVIVWMSLISWDTIVAKHYPYLVWHTPDFPPSVSYIPFMVLVFIFGNIGINMWSRR